jgi:glycosyltransferase involved in cell wall biosynthesis
VHREACRFWREEGQGNFDLVLDEVNTQFGGPKWAKGVPVVALIHQVAKKIWLSTALLGRLWLEKRRLASYRDTTPVTVSTSSRQSFEAYGLRNVTVVPEGMDLTPESLTSDPPEKEDTLTFAFVGRLSSNKRPHHVLEAFKIVHRQFPEVRLWVMGTGPTETKLRSRTPPWRRGFESDLKCEKLERLCTAHAFLVRLVREDRGLVVSDAATVGTPSVGYRMPVLSDSIGASGGLLIDAKPCALAASLVAEIPHLLAGKY